MNQRLQYAKMLEIPFGHIQPGGWLRQYLTDQRNGLTGHLDEIGYPFTTRCWAKQEGVGGGYCPWWPYEQTAYYLDAVSRCGHLLQDEMLIRKFRDVVDAAIRFQDPDGYLGPREIKQNVPNAQWPHSILSRAVCAHSQATGDPSYLDALVKHYKSGTCQYNDGRDVANVEALVLLYAQTGDETLLELARKAFREFNAREDGHDEGNQVARTSDVTLKGLASDQRISTHGVTFSELSKLGAVLYLAVGDREMLDAVVHGFRKAEEQALLVDGVVSSTEALKGCTPDDCHETCDISDYTWALGYLLMATGDAHYADIIERAMLNAAPSVYYDHFRAHLYFSAPNMVIAKPNSNSSHSYAYTPRMAYQPNHYPECCVGNGQRAMPNYVSRMYMTCPGGICVNFYGQSTLNLETEGNHIMISQQTDYPFEEQVRLQIHCDRDFTLTCRVPGWCQGAQITAGGRTSAAEPGYQAVEVSDGMEVLLTFPMPVQVKRWKTGGLYVEKGPVLYTLKIQEHIEHDKKEKRQTPEFPAYAMTPASPFNYGLNPETARSTIEETDCKTGTNPFFDGAPHEIRLKARRIRHWSIQKVLLSRKDREQAMARMIRLGTGVIEKPRLEITPVMPRKNFIRTHLGKEETVTLIPYGCSNLRLTVFPEIP